MIGEVLFGIGYLLLCVLVGRITREKPIIGFNKHLGFWAGFYASFFMTPLVVYFLFLCIPDRKVKKNRSRTSA